MRLKTSIERLKVGVEGLLDVRVQTVWNLGLSTQSEKLDEVQAVVGALCIELGLNMEDEQAADAYLADGRVVSRRPAARCMNATAA